MNIDFSIIDDAIQFNNHEGMKVNYSSDPISTNEFLIRNSDLLFENSIKEQAIECFEINNYKAFFKNAEADFPFDILAASFYLLSRYEEYLPHKKDNYGRYAHENSLAFKEHFLHLPIINIWTEDLAIQLQQKFSTYTFQLLADGKKAPTFSFIPTYDIDIAYSFKHKGFLRNVGGFLKSPSLERIVVLAGLKKDPFDVYNWLDDLHREYQLQPIYFFLLASKNGIYDKNILPDTKGMSQLIRRHAEKYKVAIHPSWQSGDNEILLKKEVASLNSICFPNQPDSLNIRHSRQHYIRFNLPEGYSKLYNAGIVNEYSMGYGSINGFRASVATSFYWYDLKSEHTTKLKVHPFCYMEANSYYEQKLTPPDAFSEMMHYYNICREVNGTLITIWHNHMLGSDELYKGWSEIYLKFIQKTCV